MIASPEDCSYGVSKSASSTSRARSRSTTRKDSIICNAVAPGKILTGKGGRAVEPRWIDYSHARTPLPRLGRSEDVANAALFLASDEATFITGENLMVDGGWMAAGQHVTFHWRRSPSSSTASLRELGRRPSKSHHAVDDD